MLTSVDLRGGQIVVLEPGICMYEGLESDPSLGYFDKYCTPPIDTWIAYMSGHQGGILLAWVPKPFVQPVQAAIDINCTGCIAWLQDTPQPALDEIRRRVSS